MSYSLIYWSKKHLYKTNLVDSYKKASGWDSRATIISVKSVKKLLKEINKNQ